MSKEKENILRMFDFEEDMLDMSYEGYKRVDHSFKLTTEKGQIEYIVSTDTLYIWSGMGLGYYSADINIDNIDEDNQQYGYEIKIQDEVHLQHVLVALLYAPPKDTLDCAISDKTYMFKS